MDKNKLYTAHDTWTVTTEGDCEGKSTRNLGTHTGYIDEIALALADKCYYSLHFERAKQLDRSPKKDSVEVTLEIGSGTWDMPADKRAETLQKLLDASGRKNVRVEKGQYYASSKIISNIPLSPEDGDALMEVIVAQYDPEIGATLVLTDNPERKMICLNNFQHTKEFREAYIGSIDTQMAENGVVLESELDEVFFTFFPEQRQYAQMSGGASCGFN